MVSIETLNAAAVRFRDHADGILARRDVARDLHYAADIASGLAHLRFCVAEIAAKTTDLKAADELRNCLVEELP